MHLWLEQPQHPWGWTYDVKKAMCLYATHIFPPEQKIIRTKLQTGCGVTSGPESTKACCVTVVIERGISIVNVSSFCIQLTIIMPLIIIRDQWKEDAHILHLHSH